MRRSHSQPSARDSNAPACAPNSPGESLRPKRAKRCRAMAACFIAALALAAATGPCTAFGLGPAQVGEDYLNNPLHDGSHNRTAASPEAADEPPLRASELLDPGSRLWAGAQALRLTRGQAQRLLAENVIAGTGDGQAAAAARADGSLQIIGPFACAAARTPGGRPALALALAARGGILAAWAQGADDIIFYELGTAGCAATMSAAPFTGEADIALSPGGELLAAHDASGALWLGPRGGELRVVARMPAPLALLSFSESGGTLAAISQSGKGGVWNARTGAMLRSLDIAGGPFRSGVLRDADAWLRKADGTALRWNLPRGAQAAEAAEEPQRHRDWVELRGNALFLVSTRSKWRADPVYEPALPLLDWSARRKALRLRDVDGLVRYFDAQTGKPVLQVFAEDWTSLPLDAQGRAQVQGRSFRVFDTLEAPGAGRPGDSRINIRAVSADSVLLWTIAPRDGEIRVAGPGNPPSGALQGIAEAPPALPWRNSLEDAPAQRFLRIK